MSVFALESIIIKYKGIDQAACYFVSTYYDLTGYYNLLKEKAICENINFRSFAFVLSTCGKKVEKIEYITLYEGRIKRKVSNFVAPKIGNMDIWGNKIYALSDLKNKEQKTISFKTISVHYGELNVKEYQNIDGALLLTRKTVYNTDVKDNSDGTYDYKDFIAKEKTSADNYFSIDSDESYY